MLKIRFLAVGVLLSLLAADTASAGLFRLGQRRWDRRKAELRAELVNDLSHKLDQDLAREVEAVTDKLTIAAQDQVKMEAARLEQQVQQALVQLREEAGKLVAAETERLDKQINEQVVQLQQKSQETVSGEAARLKEQTEKQLGELNAKFAEKSKALQTTVDEAINRLPAMISLQVEQSLQRVEAKPVDTATKENPTDSAPNENSGVQATPPTAAPTKEVQITDSTAAGQE